MPRELSCIDLGFACDAVFGAENDDQRLRALIRDHE